MKTSGDKRVVVTGGAGFIGSFLVRKLLGNDYWVYVFDNFSKKNNLADISHEKLCVIKGDCRYARDVAKIPKDIDVLFHLAADPEVNISLTSPQSIIENNILATHYILEWFKNSECKTILFTSTSTVYGEVKILPTPETYLPCYPISLYGHSKLACEVLVTSCCHTCKKQCVLLRLANIVGPHSDHGIIPDLINKLTKSTPSLEVLGNGSQQKSYLHVDDCVEGMLIILNKNNSLLSIYNLGSESQISVNEIVDIILKQKNLLHTKKIFTGGTDGGRGWPGDVMNMLLDISKIKDLGWKSKLNSKEAVEKTVKEILHF